MLWPENIANHASDVWAASEAVFAEAKEGGVTRFDEDLSSNNRIFLNYAVMEKAEKVSMVPAGFGWSDVGSWEAGNLSAHEGDAKGNSIVGNNVQFVGASATHIESISHTEKTIVAVGVENLVIIDTRTLCFSRMRAKSQDVKLVVEALNAGANAGLTEFPATIHRQQQGHIRRLSMRKAIS